jgi:hypothetical protein
VDALCVSPGKAGVDSDIMLVDSWIGPNENAWLCVDTPVEPSDDECWEDPFGSYAIFTGTYDVSNNLFGAVTDTVPCDGGSDGTGGRAVVRAPDRSAATDICVSLGHDDPHATTMVEDGWIGPPADAWACR